jgi:hypothetical protein
MSTPWDSWSSNTDNWSAATYHWEDHLFYPNVSTLGLAGYAPAEVGNYLFYPDYATLTLGGYAPTAGISLAPSIPAGTLSINGIAPIFAKGIFTTVPSTNLLLGPTQWADSSYTWAADPFNWNDYGKAPIVGQTHSYDPVSGVLTLNGKDVGVLWKDPTWKPTIWVI